MTVNRWLDVWLNIGTRKSRSSSMYPELELLSATLLPSHGPRVVASVKVRIHVDVEALAPPAVSIDVTVPADKLRVPAAAVAEPVALPPLSSDALEDDS